MNQPTGVKSEETETPKKKLIEPRTLKGFRDLLPRDTIIKNHMLGKLSVVFESFGFVPIQTPHLEYTECLFGDAGSEIQKQVYRFNDNGGRDVAMRFDLTVPFARFISQHKHEVGLPFKRWATGSVFRGENTQAGRYREFTQCDFDFVGTESLAADAEIVQVIAASMQALGVSPFQIRINNRKVMNGVMAWLGVSDRASQILIEVDKLDKVGEAAVSESLQKNIGLSEKAASSLLEFIKLSAEAVNNSVLINKLAQYRSNHPLLGEGLAELESIMALLSGVGITDPLVRIDLSIARGLGYYTGIIYETTLLNCPTIGSVCSGGRYDNLTQTFQKDRCPGVGASVGLDRLIAALDQLKLLPSTATAAKVLITVPTLEAIGQSLKVGAQLRTLGIEAEVYPDPHKMKKQIDYVKRSGHPFIVTFPQGQSDLMLEDMSNGERLPCKDVKALHGEIVRRLAAKR